MAATAEERIPAFKSSEDIFSLAVPFAAIESEHRIGANAPEGKKSHQGIFLKKRKTASGAMWVKWPGTHQVSGQWWSETVLGIVIDANGNTLTDPSGKSYAWDFDNRLAQVTLAGSGGAVTFEYDPLGRRIRKNSNSAVVGYLYDGKNLLEEIDSSGNVAAQYTQSLELDSPLVMHRAATDSYYEQDALGSVTSVTNASGAIAGTYTYNSFGNKLTSTGAVTNPFQFAGREFDSDSGLYFDRARYYDSNSGRFLSEDPIGFESDTNFYRYGQNNPTDLIDPLGLFGAPKPGDTGWRACTAKEVAFCIESCATLGKTYESCAVGQTYRNKGRGFRWHDYVGDPSCSCEDPDDNPSKACKELEPYKKGDINPLGLCPPGDDLVECYSEPRSAPTWSIPKLPSTPPPIVFPPWVWIYAF